jgi:hypothetical protein
MIATDILAWGKTTAIALAWSHGEGDAWIGGWIGADGASAIQTNGNTIWFEATDLDEPFSVLWDRAAAGGAL